MDRKGCLQFEQGPKMFGDQYPKNVFPCQHFVVWHFCARHLIPTSSKFLDQSDFFFRLLTCLLWTFNSCFSISRLSPAKESLVSNSSKVQANSIHRVGWDIEVNVNVSFRKVQNFISYCLNARGNWAESETSYCSHNFYLIPHLKLIKLTS